MLIRRDKVLVTHLKTKSSDDARRTCLLRQIIARMPERKNHENDDGVSVEAGVLPARMVV